jgi:hypothetical protein
VKQSPDIFRNLPPTRHSISKSINFPYMEIFVSNDNNEIDQSMISIFLYEDERIIWR